MSYTLKTNHQPRYLHTYEELDERAQAQFTYLDAEESGTPRFFKYRGSWYDALEFVVAPDDVKALGFDGVESESAFSAVVVQWFDRDGYERDGEVVVGYLHW